jgi:YidC/Oxa1 family membrane protein insertase
MAPDSARVTVTAPPAAAVPVDSTVVSDSLARWVFSNRGARILAVELLRHKRLGGDSGNVQLVREDEALVDFNLRLGTDTIALSDVVFESNVIRGASGSVERIEYSTVVPGSTQRFVVTYTPVPNRYLMQVTGRLENAPSPAFLIAALPSGLRSGEANPGEDQMHYAVAYKRARGDVQGISFGSLDPRELHRSDPATPVTWVAVKSKYFIVGLLKPSGDATVTDTAFTQVESVGGPRTVNAATHVHTVALDDLSDGGFTFEIYAGPQEFRRLVALGRDFQNSNPYGGFLQPIVQPFAVLVMRSLLWLKDTTKLEYGWVLVLFGVLVRVVLWPLNQKAMRATIKMQRIQPELTEAQNKHKGNPQRQQEELLRIYKEHGMTPFSPLAGCLPMFIPLPVLFALFFVFQNTIEFRGVPFLWLPDISLKDPLYIVPIFMGLTMFATSWLTSRTAPPNPQMKIMMYAMPALFMFLFLNFASGLNLYYAVQNVAAMPQQWLISRERARQLPPPASSAKPASGNKAKK